MSNCSDFRVRQLYSQAIAKEIDPIAALWSALEEYKRLLSAYLIAQPKADAFETFQTVLGEGVDALIKAKNGWAIVDQNTDVVVQSPDLLLLARACAPTADRIHRERDARRLADRQGRDHYAWRGGRS